MGNRFASGKNSIAECDRCGQRFKLTQLKKEVKKTKVYNLLVCQQCWDPDQPQLQLGMWPVEDPQAVREPRRDMTYIQSGATATGTLGLGSREIQWGWNPVGGASQFDAVLTPNYLVSIAELGTVAVIL
jgi:hypothetical protein